MSGRGGNSTDADCGVLRAKARIEAAAALWEQENRDPSRLLAEGWPLAEGEEILRSRRQDLSPDLIAFIEASAAHARRGRQRKRAIPGGVMATLALLIGLSLWFGYDARVKEREVTAQRERAEQQHQIALARQLAAEASILADRGGSDATIERAAALAIESWRRMHNPEAADAADRIIRMLPSVCIAHGERVFRIAFSSDGRLLETASGNTAQLTELPSGREVARIGHGDGVHSVIFSPDGQFLATASNDNTARLIETASSTEVARIAHVEDVAFSPDGRLLATRNDDGTAGLMWADPQHLFDLLCAKAGRNLSAGEWRTYIGADEPWHPTCPNWRTAEAPAQDC